MKIDIGPEDLEFIIARVVTLLHPKSSKAPKETKDEDEKLSIKEISGRYKIPMQQAKLLVTTGALPSEKIGSTVKVSRKSLEEWLEKGGKSENKEEDR